MTMKLLHTLTHPAITAGGRMFERQAVRAVVTRGSDILLLYTRRYDDYSFPGGGLDTGEDPIEGLRRELVEETGAKDVIVEHVIGHLDESRPPLKAGYDVLFMRSHFYLCRVAGELGVATPEAYEVANGMVPVWIDIGKALEHNRSVLASKPPNMGLSIERETWMLQYVMDHIRSTSAA
jgi:8-oxo-dGTP pyrophosphatase MutT (NUDIX family)